MWTSIISIVIFLSSLRIDGTWSWYSITTQSRNDLHARSIWKDMMIFYPWSLIICTTFISMTDPIFLPPGILWWILDRRSLLEYIYIYIYILCTDYQRLHVHLADLVLWWSNPTYWPFLFHDIKWQSMEIWLYWTCQWMFFFFKFPLNPLSKSLITLKVDIEDCTSTATTLFVEHWHEYDPVRESFWFNVLTS